MNSLRWIMSSCVAAVALGSASVEASMLYEFQFAGNYNNTGTQFGTGTVGGPTWAGTIGLSSDNVYGSAADQSLVINDTHPSLTARYLTAPPDDGALLMDGTKSVSIAAWIKPTLTQQGGIVSRSEDNNAGWSFRAGSNTLYMESGSNLAGSAAGVLALNQWQYVGVTWNPGAHQLVFYVNGVAEAASQNWGQNLTADTNGLATTPVRVGSANGFIPFNGNIDTVRVWDEYKSSGDMQQLYQTELAMIPEPASCVLVLAGGMGLLAARRRHA